MCVQRQKDSIITISLSLSPSLYIYTYTHIYIYITICISIYIYIYICIYTEYTNTHMYFITCSARKVSRKVDWDLTRGLIPLLPPILPEFLDIGRQPVARTSMDTRSLRTPGCHSCFFLFSTPFCTFLHAQRAALCLCMLCTTLVLILKPN
jgi:hypothetical protein